MGQTERAVAVGGLCEALWAEQRGKLFVRDVGLDVGLHVASVARTWALRPCVPAELVFSMASCV